MELIEDLLKISLPAALVMYGIYLTVQAFVKKELGQIEQIREEQTAALEMKKQEARIKEKNELLPIRLQAYERVCLLLERISPAQLIPRVNNPEFSVGLFQQVLIQEIRNEFGHNISQQMYVSDEAWLLTKQAMEETIMLINNTAANLPEGAPGLELAKAILENVRQHEIRPTSNALQYLKNEIREFF